MGEQDLPRAKVSFALSGIHYGRLPCTAGQVVSCTRVLAEGASETEIMLCARGGPTERPSAHRALRSHDPVYQRTCFLKISRRLENLILQALGDVCGEPDRKAGGGHVVIKCLGSPRILSL